jgi:hypothetical protein
MGEENTQGAGTRRSRSGKRLIRRAGRASCVGGRDRLRAVCGSDRSSEGDGGPRPDRSWPPCSAPTWRSSPRAPRSYVSTIAYASEAFGYKIVRQQTPADVSAFNRLVRDRGVATSARAKHLRVLGVCLNSAVQHGYAARNPARDLPKAERPRPSRKEAAYFENEELPRLFAETRHAGRGRAKGEAQSIPERAHEAIGLGWADSHPGANALSAPGLRVI